MGFVLPKPKTLKSGALIARQVIPADVRDEYQRLYGKAWEERWRADPGTSIAEQKKSYAAWYAEIWRRLEAIRAARRGDAIELTRTDAAALAGEWYSWYVARHEENPGKPDRWEHELWWFVDEMLQYAPDEVRAEPMRNLEWSRDPEIRAGIKPVVADAAHTAQFLASRGITLTSAAQTLFLDFVVDSYVDALWLLERRARNDYSPDDNLQTFPKFSLLQQRSTDNQSPRQLYEAWAAARKPATATISRWTPVFDDLEMAFSGAEAQPLTEDTAQAWANEKITDERSPATVKEVWVNAASTVYRWAKDQRLIANNPFVAVNVTVPRKTRNRENNAFTAEEAQIILRAATAVQDTKRPFNAAKRWVPWLCAYSGARAGEITQLRGSDVQRRAEFYVMRLLPEAGTIKTREARAVPLHDHLIEQGFIEFVHARGKGPLFYDYEKDEQSTKNPMRPKRPRAGRTRARLAKWIRTLGIADPEVQPNHAWRHGFKQIAERSGISSRVVVVLFDDFVLPKAASICTTQGLRAHNVDEGDLGAMTTMRSNPKGVASISDGAVLRQIRQLALRGNVRNYDEHGVCSKMRLVIACDQKRFMSNVHTLCPGVLNRNIKIVGGVDDDDARSTVQAQVIALLRETSKDVLSTKEISRHIGREWRSVVHYVRKPPFDSIIATDRWKYLPGNGCKGSSFKRMPLNASEGAPNRAEGELSAFM